MTDPRKHKAFPERSASRDMKPMCIFKMGTTFPDTADAYGDFHRWTAEHAGLPEDRVRVVDVEHGEELPDHEDCAGVIMTGSHSMVTDRLDWTVNTERWIGEALKLELPVLGICYGHQVLASAAGGTVGKLTGGAEIGTTTITPTNAAAGDPLFSSVPTRFSAHTTHSESVLSLPEDAELLATGERDPHHAFRLGPKAWGVQFHPEYTPAIMRSYVEHQRNVLQTAGREPDSVLQAVTETPEATGILRRFVALFCG